MGSESKRCTCCGMQMIVPHNASAIQCPLCQTIFHVKLKDPSGHHSQSKISNAVSRVMDLVEKTSSNINILVAHVQSHAGSGASGYGYYQKPARPSAPLAPVSTHGGRRAVLCGVSYSGKPDELYGTVNDVNCMRYLLVQKLGFPKDSILVLTEEESKPHLIPTRKNIMMAMNWLMHGCKLGDSLVFYFSGHGSRYPNEKGDEVDGYDEAILPMDHEDEGEILDDEINATIVRPLPRGAKLHAIMDSCHSGTVLDLPFVCKLHRDGRYKWEDQGQISYTYNGKKGGLAISISACGDQFSMDSTELGDVGRGAMTYSFIRAIQKEPGLTYGQLISSMRRILRDPKAGFRTYGHVASRVRKVQETQLSSSEKFDIYSTKFAL